MKVLVTAAVALGVLTVGPTFASQELATAKNCMACHAVDRQLVGPSYQAVAEKRGGEEDAVATLALKIKQGGAGVYGPVPMPPNPQLSDEEAVALAEWVLTFK